MRARHLLLATLFLGAVAQPTVLGQTEPLHSFAEKGKYGFKNDDGVVRIPPRYDGSGEFREGLAPVALIRGTEVAYQGSYGPECFAPALVWGYIDAAGRTAIPHRYADAKPFSQGVAAVRLGEVWGYITTTGAWAIQPIYEAARDFRNGVAEVNLKGTRRFISLKGDETRAPANADAGERSGISFRYDPGPPPARTYTLTDPAGKVILTRGDGLEWLGEGRIVYGRDPDGPVGLMDADGRVITPQQFQQISMFTGGLAGVKVKGVWGFIDRAGKMVIRPSRFVKVGDFKEGLAPACVSTDARLPEGGLDQRCGFIDTSGNLVLQPRFAFAGSFKNGWAQVGDPVFRNSLLINRKGAIVHRAAPDDKPRRQLSGKCQFPPPAPAPPQRDYSQAVGLRSSPPGASVYLVPLWDWQSHGDGQRLLSTPDLLSLYLVTPGTTPFTALKLKMQVYVAVFELAGKRKVSRLVVSADGPHQLDVSF